MDNKTSAILDRLESTADAFWNISHQTGNFIRIKKKKKKKKEGNYD